MKGEPSLWSFLKGIPPGLWSFLLGVPLGLGFLILSWFLGDTSVRHVARGYPTQTCSQGVPQSDL